MGETIEATNPFLSKFSRKKNSKGAWVSVGEGGRSTFDAVLELDKNLFLDELMRQLADMLGLASKNEKLLIEFIFSIVKKCDIRNEPVFLDLSGAKKYAKKKGKSVSKSTFQRGLTSFSHAGLILPSEKKAWFYLNPDIFGLTGEFSVRVKYTTRKNSKKCDQTGDFFTGRECILVPKR
jgi:hypothetical protein